MSIFFFFPFRKEKLWMTLWPILNGRFPPPFFNRRWLECLGKIKKKKSYTPSQKYWWPKRWWSAAVADSMRAPSGVNQKLGEQGNSPGFFAISTRQHEETISRWFTLVLSTRHQHVIFSICVIGSALLFLLHNNRQSHDFVLRLKFCDFTIFWKDNMNYYRWRSFLTLFRWWQFVVL